MKEIKAIGFDLDQTLYPKSPEIDTAIQTYIYHKIAECKGCGLDRAKELFTNLYPKHSGRESLMKLGVPNASNVVQEALEKADLAKWLKPNPETIKLLKELKAKYGKLALITGSDEKNAREKLAKLKISEDLFDVMIFGDVSKRDGTAYRQWMSKYPELKPFEFLYVGDRKSTDVDVPSTLGMRAVLVNVKEGPESQASFKRLADIRAALLGQPL